MRKRRGTTLLVALAILIALSILGLSLMLSTAKVTVGTRELMRFREISNAHAVLELLQGVMGSGTIPRSEWNSRSLRSKWPAVWTPAGGSLDRFDLLALRPDGRSGYASGLQPPLVSELYRVAASTPGDPPARVDEVLDVHGQKAEAFSAAERPEERPSTWLVDRPGSGLAAFSAQGDPVPAAAGRGSELLALWTSKDSIDFASGYSEPLRPGALLRSLGAQDASGKVAFWPGRNLVSVAGGEFRRMAAPAGGHPVPKQFGPPVIVGPPGNVWAAGKNDLGYSEFAWKHRSRRRFVLASSDSAAVHAVDLVTGSEAFALAGAAGRRQDLVPVTFEDVVINAPWAGGGTDCARLLGRAGLNCQWRTVAFVSRSGGGVVALDITQPDPESSSPNAPGCLQDPNGAKDLLCSGPFPALAWEAGPEKLPEAAESAGSIAAGRLRIRTGEGREEDRFVVLLGGGLDRSDLITAGKGPVPANRKGAVLYALDAGTGNVLLKWDRGVRYREEKAEERRFASVTGGVSAVDTDGDGLTDLVVFGDLNGSIWALRTSGAVDSATVPEMLFDGTIGEKGIPDCAGKNADGTAVGCGGERGVFHPPLVFARGRLAGPRLGVAWVTGGGPLEAFRSGPSLVFSMPLVQKQTLGKNELAAIPSLDSRETACGGAPTGPREGFRVSLSGSERSAGGLLGGNGYLLLGTTGSADGPRIYRLEMNGGGACFGADCCKGSPGFWSEANGVIKPGNEAAGSSPRVFTSSRGGLFVGVVRDRGKGPQELFLRPLGLRMDETGTREQ